MAFSIEHILDDTRADGITLDHIKYTNLALASVSTVQSPNLNHAELQVSPASRRLEQLRIPREAVSILQALCCGRNKLASTSILDQDGPTKIELPLLSTTHEYDLVTFEKAMNVKQLEYLEQPDVIDCTTFDQELCALDGEGKAKPRSESRFKTNFKIQQESANMLRALIQTQTVCTSTGNVKTGHKSLPFLSSPLMPYEQPEALPFLSQLDLEMQAESDQGLEALRQPVVQFLNKDISIPNGTPENLLDLDNLEPMLARCSMTPEPRNYRQQVCQDMKLPSPLTPPNTVRPHRFLANRSQAVLQDVNFTPLKRLSTKSNSPTENDLSQLQYSRNAIDDRLAKDQLQPRLLGPKIKLPDVSPVGAFSSQPTTWTTTTNQAFRHTLFEDTKKHMLLETAGTHLSWAPWAPQPFDSWHFQKRFKLSIGEDIPTFSIGLQPLDPRTLVYLISDDSSETETLSPGVLPDPNALSSLLKKRRYEAFGTNGDAPKKKRSSTSVHDPSILEARFSDRGFNLLAKEKKSFVRPVDSVTARMRTKDHSSEAKPSVPIKNQSARNRPATLPQKHTRKAQIISTSSGSSVRKVMRIVSRLTTSIENIERDFTGSWAVEDGTSADADILLSPTVGLLLTSTEELLQQPLPGSTKLTKIRAKIDKVASKFEHLIIIVRTEGGTTATYQALSDITNYVGNLKRASNTNIEVLSCIGVEEQAREILSLIDKYSIATSAFSLTSDETPAELDLRKDVKLNAYAAQALVQLTCKRNKLNTAEALVMIKNMNDEERKNSFGHVVGERSISRVNAALSKSPITLTESKLKARHMYH